MLHWSHAKVVETHLRSALETLGPETPTRQPESTPDRGRFATGTAAHKPTLPSRQQSGAVALRATEMPKLSPFDAPVADILPFQQGGALRRNFPAAASAGAAWPGHALASGPAASSRLRVVVSLLSLRLGAIGGTETYLRQLIARLPKVDPRHEIILLMDRDLAETNVFSGMERVVVDRSARQVLKERALEAMSPYRCRAIEKTLQSLRPDVVFFPQQSIFPKNVPAPCMLVVHDLYHLYLPQYLSRGQRLFRQRNYAQSVARADRIIAISEFTKKTILQHYDVADERVSVIPHGWTPSAVALDSAHSDSAEAGSTAREASGGYLYFPAITRPHKNHQALLESLAVLRSQKRFDGELILSGIQTPYWKTLRRTIGKLGLDSVVHHLGYVSYDHVRRLYQEADCVVFPTTFEGFGLPVLEAVEARKKILVSRLDVFDEIGVPERFQIDFSDPEQLARGLQEPGITELTKRPWTWDESAAATLEWLEATANRPSSTRVVARAA
jgi:glycosyltransferase involved in cell wall biosynthesis